MKLSITKVAILPTRTGNGLKVGDVLLGCARITEIATEEGKTLRDYAMEGLCLGYEIGTRPTEGEEQGDTNIVMLKEDSLDTANNYALVIIDKDGGASVVLNTKDITDMYQLPAEDAIEMDKYIGALADRHNLEMVRYNDLQSDEEAFFFTTKVDREINEDVLSDDNPEIEGDAETAAAKLMQLNRSPQFRAEVETHNFIKLFVVDLVQAGESRYNKSHRDDVIAEISKKITEVTYWADGTLYRPSIADIDNFMDIIKANIRV